LLIGGSVSPHRFDLLAQQMADELTLLKPKPSRSEHTASMDIEILDVEGVARALGVSTRTIYDLARKGKIPAMRVGREWRFARQNLIKWIANGSEADQLAAALRNGRLVRKRT
jgi:excisionase family DNA binding protein